MTVKVYKLKKGKRRSPWVVRRYKDRLPVRKFFASKEQANIYARDLRKMIRLGGDPDALIDFQKQIAGSNFDPKAVAAAGLAALRANGTPSAENEATLGDAMKRYMAKCGGLRAKTLKGYNNYFENIDKVFGGRRASSITEAEVQAFLDSRMDRQGNIGKAAPDTKKKYVALIKMAFRELKIKDPFPDIRVRMPKERTIKFFTNEEIYKLFVGSKPCELGFLALATFAAIRPETLAELPIDCINVKDRRVFIPAHISKDHCAHCLETVAVGHEREVRPGPPPIVWAWLERYPFQRVKWCYFQRRLRRILSGKWIHDGLRHTGATNYCTKWGYVATAELLTHNTFDMVKKHYAAPTTREKAEEFLNFGPNDLEHMPNFPKPELKRIKWPPDEILKAMLLDRPATYIARELACSDSRLSAYCKERGIPKFGRGEWRDWKRNREAI
jgi:hypothetical protein